MNKWNKRFIELAEFISKWSKDPSTKVGAVIVGEDKMGVRDHIQLEIEYYHCEGVVSWSSDNDEVAVVDEYGIVSGVSQGKVTITATLGELSECHVIIVE